MLVNAYCFHICMFLLIPKAKVGIQWPYDLAGIRFVLAKTAGYHEFSLSKAAKFAT